MERTISTKITLTIHTYKGDTNKEWELYENESLQNFMYRVVHDINYIFYGD